MLGKLSGEEQTDGGLDLPGCQSGASVVVGEAAGLGGNTLKDVVDKRVHDAHGLGADAGVWVHLLQHLVDVDAVGLPPPLPAFLVTGPLGFRLGGGLLRTLAGWSLFWWHGYELWGTSASTKYISDDLG